MMTEKIREPLLAGSEILLTFLETGDTVLTDGGALREALSEAPVLYTQNVRIKRQLTKADHGAADGSTCLAYEGAFLQNGRETKRVIIKEFYPNILEGFDRDEDTQALKISRILHVSEEYREEFESRLAQFWKGYIKQCQYSMETELMEIIVRPYGLAGFGDSYYLVSDMNNGSTLDSVSFSGVKEKMNLLMHLSDLLCVLERRGILFLDICPENMLYINQTDKIQQLKLFDIDSFLELDAIEQIRLSDICYHTDYVSPRLLFLTGSGYDFDWKKKSYLHPDLCVYSLGVIAFELFCGHKPSARDLKFSEKTESSLRAYLKKEYGMSGNEAGELLALIKELLDKNAHNSAQVADAKIKQLYKKQSVREWLPKKKVPPANYLYAGYHILKTFPVFEYAHIREDGRRILDVSLIGSHEMRKQVLRALIPCCQMLDSELRIRMFSEDVREFWNQLVSDEENPELGPAVRLYMNDEQIGVDLDETLVNGALADIYLYDTTDVESVINILEENRSDYRFLLDTDPARNVQLAAKMAKRSQKADTVFLGMIAEPEEIPKVPGTIRCYPISLEKVSEGYYDEKKVKTDIESMGYEVHADYYRGGHPWAEEKDIEKDYRSNGYYRESSERTALHMIYKLASIGITDMRSKTLLQDLYAEIFCPDSASARQNLDRLACLEHRSWSAFMIMRGWRRLPMDEFENVAYAGGNTWKDESDPKHPRHPYLVSSRPGRALQHVDRLSANVLKTWDCLDQTSFRVYHMLLNMAEERKDRIKDLIDDITKDIDWSKYPYPEADFLWVRDAVEKCYGLETSAKDNWAKAMDAFYHSCEDAGVLTPRIKETISEIQDQMKPLLEALKRNDIKKADEDVIRSIPRLAARMQGESLNHITLIKPVSDKMWQNVYSALMIRPKKLILIGKPDEKVDLDRYQMFFRNMGMRDMLLGDAMPKRGQGKILIDFTGASPEEIYRLMPLPVTRKASHFSIEGRRIKSWNDDSLYLFQREVRLTVEQTLQLAGAHDTSMKKPNYITQLNSVQYRQLWFSYMRMGKNRWKAFIFLLNKYRKPGRYTVSLESSSNQFEKYETEPISKIALQYSGLDIILARCKKERLIRQLKMSDHLPVTFFTENKYLGRLLVKLVRETAGAGVGEHIYSIKSWGDTSIKIVDESLYMEFEIPHEAVPNISVKEYQDELMERSLQNIDYMQKKNMVFRNVKIDQTDQGRRFRFFYASKAVRDVLENEGSILEAVVYFECLRNQIFDDIRINSEFDWKLGSNVHNEIDVIATKNSKTYFISVKMQPPEKQFLEEIGYLCSRFSIEGQPILVASHQSGVNSETENNLPLNQRSSLMNVKYIDLNGILSKDGKELILADTIEKIVKES